MKILSVVIIPLILISAGAASSVQAVGSRDNPVPIGTSVDISDDWQITVLDVFPNATDEMVYGKEPTLTFKRDPGTEFFIAKIQAKYIGARSSHFDSDYLKVVGSASVGYSPINHIQAESIIPEQIPYNEVFTSGVITGIVVWMIPPADANRLVMYDGTAEFDKRTYMALFRS